MHAQPLLRGTPPHSAGAPGPAAAPNQAPLPHLALGIRQQVVRQPMLALPVDLQCKGRTRAQPRHEWSSCTQPTTLRVGQRAAARGAWAALALQRGDTRGCKHWMHTHLALRLVEAHAIDRKASALKLLHPGRAAAPSAGKSSSGGAAGMQVRARNAKRVLRSPPAPALILSRKPQACLVQPPTYSGGRAGESSARRARGGPAAGLLPWLPRLPSLGASPVLARGYMKMTPPCSLNRSCGRAGHSGAAGGTAGGVWAACVLWQAKQQPAQGQEQRRFITATGCS